jgi:hypothetical protein
LKKIAREKELSEKKAPYSKRTFCKEVNAIALRVGKNRDIKIVEKALKHEQGKHGKKERNTQKWPVPKRLNLGTQTPPMNSFMLWNWVKESLARKDLRSVLSDLNIKEIKSTSKIQNQMMIAKCLPKSAVKYLKRSLIPWTQNPLRRLMKMRITRQATRKKPSSSLLTKRRTVTLTLIDP